MAATSLILQFLVDMRMDKLEHGGGATDHPETVHTFDSRHAEMLGSAPEQQLKTRLYFTSESHVYTLLNLLRYAHERHPVPKLIDEAGEATLEWASELSYLTQILFYVYEHREHPVGSPLRFQVQVLFSAGDGLEPMNPPKNSPKKAPSGEPGVERVHSSGAQPLHTLHASLPLADVLNFFDRLSKV